MNITIKQLLDIVSLSIEAVNMKTDPTIPSHTENSFFLNGTSTALVTPVENEISTILGDNPVTLEVAKALNEHIAAIRLGMRLRESE